MEQMEADSRNRNDSKNSMFAQPRVYETLKLDGKELVEEPIYSSLNRKTRTRCIIVLLTISIIVIATTMVIIGVVFGVVLNRKTQDLSSACTQDSDCGKNAVCGGSSNNTCTCKPGYKTFHDQTTCTLGLTSACTQDGDCSALSNSACSGVSSKTCTCKPGYIPSSDQLSCNTVLTNVCTEDSECSAVTNSVCSGSSSKTCACKTGYNTSSDQLSCTTVLTRACTQGSDCSAVSNSACSGAYSKTCTCKPGYKRTSDQSSCTIVLTYVCTEDSECSAVANSVCSGSSSKTCACKPGYNTSSDQLSCNAGTCSGWQQFGNSCYNFLDDIPRTFVDAVEKCSQNNSHVLYIESAEENNFLKQHLQNFSVEFWWNGMTDEREEGVWRWYGSDQVVTFFNWSEGEPNGWPTENCCHIWKTYSYQWNDTPCKPPTGYEAYAICEKTIADLTA